MLTVDRTRGLVRTSISHLPDAQLLEALPGDCRHETAIVPAHRYPHVTAVMLTYCGAGLSNSSTFPARAACTPRMSTHSPDCA